MQVFRGIHHPGLAPSCALTIGNFDGVHRGHQAMLALLRSEAEHRGLPSCVTTFEPRPCDHFARINGHPHQAPARIAPLRDKLDELQRCGIDQVVVLRFDAALAAQPPQAFIDDVLLRGLGARYVLVGDDFRFGARRAGDYAMLDAAGSAQGFDVGRMNSYEVHGVRVSSSGVRAALAAGDMARAHGLLGRTHSVSGQARPRPRLPDPQRALRARHLGRPGHLRRAHPRPGPAATRWRGQPGRAPDGRGQRPADAGSALFRLARGTRPGGGLR
jgi:riboflavin kinase/FMN adenylyltransferase